MKIINPKINPVQPKERYIILDLLRGIALFGICIANFQEFSLYSFFGSDVTSLMPTAEIDGIVRYLQYIFIDGKFYTLFSLLFGIGFSIIISNVALKRGDGSAIFYRRMALLFVIGMLHLMFIWSGDILVLYALLGMFLPLFKNVSNRRLLTLSAIFLLLPIIIDGITTALNVNMSASVVAIQQNYCAEYGITDDNFGYWLRDATTYSDTFKFLVQGAFVRVQEFIDGNRLFKVMGLFLLGFYIGRDRLYAKLDENIVSLQLILKYGLIIGLPTSVLYAWSGINGYPVGLVLHTTLYTFSVFPLGFAYVAGICLWYIRNKESRIFTILAAPGRMALTNYIGQSLFGIIIFYGIGFGMGASVGLVYVTLIAVVVYAVEVILSHIWLHYFNYGPLEWVWRMLTYRKFFKLLK